MDDAMVDATNREISKQIRMRTSIDLNSEAIYFERKKEKKTQIIIINKSLLQRVVKLIALKNILAENERKKRHKNLENCLRFKASQFNLDIQLVNKLARTDMNFQVEFFALL